MNRAAVDDIRQVLDALHADDGHHNDQAMLASMLTTSQLVIEMTKRLAQVNAAKPKPPKPISMPVKAAKPIRPPKPPQPDHPIKAIRRIKPIKPFSPESESRRSS